jgi:hypothetical protein
VAVVLREHGGGSGSAFLGVAVGVTGTVIVGISGFRNTRRATEMAIQGERDHRLWDRQAAAYEAAVATLLRRRKVLNDLIETTWDAGGDDVRAKVLRFVTAYTGEAWLPRQASLLAYADDDVLTAIDAVTQADDKVIDENTLWMNLAYLDKAEKSQSEMAEDHGCYSMGDDQLWGVVRRRKGADHTLAALKSIRAARPGGYRLFVILGNLSANKTPAIRRWAKRENVELCFTPTNASWANPVEAQFGHLRTFTMGGSDHPSHTVLARKLQDYLRWRNANARHPDVLAAQHRERAPARRRRTP